MNIYTFYSHVPLHNAENELKMLLLWRDHHRRLGFTPIVLQPYHAWRHPKFAHFAAAVGKLPSINPQGYDQACYERWLAVATMKENLAVMMDYDTFLTPTVGDDLNPVTYGPEGESKAITVFQNTTPCLVTGTPRAFEQAAIWFANFKPGDRAHVSDMIILEDVASKEPNAFTRWNYAKCYGEENWKTAPAVHFSNSCMTPAGKQPRYKWIPELLKEHTML